MTKSFGLVSPSISLEFSNVFDLFDLIIQGSFEGVAKEINEKEPIQMKAIRMRNRMRPKMPSQAMGK